MLIWLAAAAVIGLFCLGMCMAGRMKKRTAVLVVLLGFYLAVIFTFTLGHRVPGRGYDYNLKLFWTIEAIRNGKKSLISECIWNVALFIPLGILLGLLFRGRCVLLPVLTGAAVSAVVELVQLVGKLGLFEFDDMIYNTAGCVIGVLAALSIRRIIMGVRQ